jgi:protein-disulfide isomerase
MSRNKPNTAKPSAAKPSAAKPNAPKRYLPFIIIAGVLAVSVGAWLVLFRTPKEADAPASDTASLYNSNNSAAPVTPAVRQVTDSTPAGATPPHALGDPNAAVTLEEFGDFQCPPCGKLHPELKKLEDLYGSQLRVVFRHFPLHSIHQHAVAAARAAEAAGRQGRFWEMHDMLYKQQDVWKNDVDVQSRFEGYARTLGLNLERFRSDMTAPAIAERLIADQKRAAALGVTSTPTLFINGREVQFSAQAYSYDGLRAKIDAALAGKNQ